MAEFPAMPLWTDAYIADTTHLTTLENGAYLLLLITMWRAGGKLPDDDKKLSRYARLSMANWLKVKSNIMPFFDKEGCDLSQKRLRKELAFVRKQSDAQRERVAARWLKNKENENTVVSDGYKPGNTPTPTPTPTPKYISSSLRSEEAHEAIEAYKKMARETGLPEMRSVSEGRKQSIKKRIADHGLPVVLEAIERVGRSSFCHGNNDRGWKADFDFICQPSSFLSILEGKYDNRVVRMPQRERTLIDIARERAAQERETMNERIIDATANSF